MALNLKKQNAYLQKQNSYARITAIMPWDLIKMAIL
jgi:hypothetical protein